jgi:hypothetical protein
MNVRIGKEMLMEGEGKKRPIYPCNRPWRPIGL